MRRRRGDMPPPRYFNRADEWGFETDWIDFIASCQTYVRAYTSWSSGFFSSFQMFREHQIDGSTLSLLTEEHMTKRLNMKLGPALKLRTHILKRMGPSFSEMCVHCAHCHSRLQHSLLGGGSTAHVAAVAAAAAESSLSRPGSRSSSLSNKEWANNRILSSN